MENLKILASLYFDMPCGSEIMEIFFFGGAGFHDSWNGPLCLKL